MSSSLLLKYKIKLHKNIILPGILDGCETWSILLNEKQRHRLLRRIFAPKRDKVRREWRKICNELHDLYSTLNILRVIKLRRMRCVGHVVRMGEK